MIETLRALVAEHPIALSVLAVVGLYTGVLIGLAIEQEVKGGKRNE
jgi:hypothetical protein